MEAQLHNRAALVIGASGGIGDALFRHWQDDSDIDTVIGVSRLQHPAYTDTATIENENSSETTWIKSDYSDSSIQDICETLSEEKSVISRICICNGILHNEDIWPDKRIEDLDSDSLDELFRINCILPMLWLKTLIPALPKDTPCIISVFSARVGSISDNELGGWYGYRASKAALNMMLKTAAIEFSRRAKNIKLIAFHPGTTDTNLSRPFLKNVTHEILQPDTVADSLIEIMNASRPDGKLSYLDWENQPIVW